MILPAFKDGIARMLTAKRLLVWIYLVSLLLALVPTLVLSEMIRNSLGHSTVAEDLLAGYNDEWFREFQAETQGLGKTFHPAVVGVAPLLDGLDQFLSGKLFGGFRGLLAVGLAYLLAWTLFTGGALHLYYARVSPSLETFATGAGRYWGRIFRLTLLGALGYLLVYRFLLSGLDEWIQAATRDIVDERLVFLWTSAKYALVGILLLFLSLLLDYAKILTVCERRQSVVLALLRALRLILGHRNRTVGLYLLLALCSLLWLLLYGLLAPGPGQSSLLTILLATLMGQLYIAGRIGIRLLFLASQLSLAEQLIKLPPPPPPAPSPES